VFESNNMLKVTELNLRGFVIGFLDCMVLRPKCLYTYMIYGVCVLNDPGGLNHC